MPDDPPDRARARTGTSRSDTAYAEAAYADSYIEVLTVRRTPTAPAPETTAIRLLGLLPGHWFCEPLVEPGRIRLRVHLTGTPGPEAVHEAITTVLADPALRGWTEQR